MILEFIELSLEEFNTYNNLLSCELISCTDIYQKPIKHKTEDLYLLEIKFNMRNLIQNILPSEIWERRTDTINYEDENYFNTDIRS